MMRNAATKRQLELLGIIYRYTEETGYPPTFEDMRERLGVRSNQSVLDHLKNLEERKLIKREEGSARSLVVTLSGYNTLGRPPLVSVLGTTAAGLPTEPIEVLGEWQKLSTEVAAPKNEIFALKISGDSMIDAGINDGDLVLVQKQKEFVSGDVVLAEHEGESTIKRFISDETPPFIYLKPENSKYSVIPVTENTYLKGKVVAVLRKGFWSSVE